MYVCRHFRQFETHRNSAFSPRCIPEGVEISVTTTEPDVVEISSEEANNAEDAMRILQELEEDPEDEDDDGGPYECDICGLMLSQKSTMDLHKQQIHVDESFYACEFCSATRIHWSEFYVHQCTSSDSKPLVCPQCQKTVSTKKQLSVHEEVHALQRRFTTKKLNNYFIRKLEEAEDAVTDWGSKPFICGVCGKMFGKLYEVEYHEKLHSEERPPPNKCTACGLTYLNKNDLNKHAMKGCNVEYARKTQPPPQ
jgi:hypothetical protein